MEGRDHLWRTGVEEGHVTNGRGVSESVGKPKVRLKGGKMEFTEGKTTTRRGRLYSNESER